MAESSSHNPSSPEITPKEEPVTLDKPESPNPFLPADQIEFTFKEIAFTTNNEVALLYPSHSNSEYFREVSDFISKCCLKEAFTRAPTQYKEYLCEFWYTVKTLDDSKIWVSTPIGGIRGDICINTFRNALRAYYLPHSSGKTGGLDQISNKDATILYCLANKVKVDYAKLIWDDIIHKLSKKTREKVVPYPRFISLLLEYMMPEYDNEELTINPTQVFSVHNWALKPNQTKGPPFTDHMKAICNLDVPVDSKAPNSSSQTEEVPQDKKPGAKSGLRRKQSSKHTSKSKTKASKSKTGQSKKETQSSSAKDKSPSHPSPPTPVVGEMHKEAQQAVGSPTSLEAISEEGAHPQLSSDQTKYARDGLKTAHTYSGTNEESRADEISKKIKLEDLSDLLKDTRSAFFTSDSPQDEPIIVLDESEEEEEVDKDKDTHATSHDDELEQQKAKAEAEVTSLKSRPSYLDINQITDLLVAELKNIQWELPIEFLDLPSEISLVQKKLKTLDSLPSLLNKGLPFEGEKNTNPATTDAELNLHDELVDILGIDVMTQYYDKKLLYDKYCDKMLKRRKSSKITNCDLLT
ncbi:hypothetical protein Tco_0280740 [Tanacetum coccineum]